MPRHSRIRIPKVSIMWMIPKSMTMITKMKILLMVMAALSHGLLSTMRRTGMWSKVSNMGGMGRDIINTGTPNCMAMWTTMKTMICGDCCWRNGSFFALLYAYIMELSGAFHTRTDRGAKGLRCVIFWGPGGH